MQNHHFKISVSIVASIVLGVAVTVSGGSLSPAGSPGATMHTLAEVYNTIASTFDSSAITANQNGSLIGQLKYINSQLGWASSSNNVYLLSSGNVGIGTSTPGTKLDISGSASVSGDLEVSGSVKGDGQALMLARVAGSTFKSIQDLQNFFHSAGWASGGSISDIGGGNISVTSGTGAIRNANNALSTVLFFDWPASTSITIPTNSVRYIGVAYNSGTPRVVSYTTDTFNSKTDFALGLVVNEGGTLHVQFNPMATGDHSANMVQRDYETMPLEPDMRTGGLMLMEMPGRTIMLSAGVLWDRLNRYAISAVDTSMGDTFSTYYRDGSSGFVRTAGVTQWPNDKYDDNSGTLVTMGAGKFSVLWFYLKPDGSIDMLYGHDEYGSARQAASEAPPTGSDLPDVVRLQSRLLGRLVFQKNAATAAAVQSAFEERFPALFDTPGITVMEGGTSITGVVSLSFAPNDFNLTNLGDSSVRIDLDYTNGPASRSIAQTITGPWTFSAANTGLTISNNASVSGTLEAGVLKSPALRSDSTFLIAPTSGIANIYGIASVSGDIYSLGNVGIGTTSATSRLRIVGTGDDKSTAALSITNASGSPTLTVLNNGSVAIGATTTDQSGLRVRPIILQGAANVSTVGSSTTVTTTGGAFADVYTGTTIVANGETRFVSVKVDDNTVTVSQAVDWSAGYPFTYRRGPIISVDDVSDTESRAFSFTRGTTSDWTLLVRREETGRNFYIRNGQTGRDILSVTERGDMALNLPSSRAGAVPNIAGTSSIFPQSYDKVFAYINATGLYYDGTAGAATSEDAPSAFPMAPNTDYIYLGTLRKSNSAFVERVTGPTVGVLKAEYWNGASWVTISGAMGYSDGTLGFTKTGTIVWNEDALTGWATTSVNGSAQYYWVRLSFTTYIGSDQVRANMIVPNSVDRLTVYKAPNDSSPTFSVSGVGRVGLGDRVRGSRLDDTSHDAPNGAALSIIDTSGLLRIWNFGTGKSGLELSAGTASVADNLSWSIHIASQAWDNGAEGLVLEHHNPEQHILTLGYTDVAAASRTMAMFESPFGDMNGSDLMRGLYLNYTNGTHSGSGNEVRGIDISGITPSANASESAIFVGSGWDYAFVASQGNVGIGTLTPGYLLTVAGTASVSRLFGAGLADCDTTASVLRWSSADGAFSCGSASTLTNVPFPIHERGSAYIVASSISFTSSGFTVTDLSGDAIVGIDYTNGPASRSIAQTITGSWNFVAGTSVSAPLEVSGALTASSSFSGAGLATCNGTTQKLVWAGGQFGCGVDQNTGGGGGGGASLQIREYGAAYNSFPATASFDAGKFALTASGASDVTISLDWGAGGPASLSQNETVTGVWTFSSPIAAVTASLSGGAEFVSYASASRYFGSALSDCSGMNQKLLYSSSTGVFSCSNEAGGGSWVEGSTIAVTNPQDRHFDAGAFNLTASGGVDVVIKLDYANGPASRSIAQTITGAWNFTGGASVSTNPFEVGSHVLYVNPVTGYVGVNTQNLSESLEVSGNASVSAALTAANIGIGTAPAAGYRLDVAGIGRFGSGVDETQNLLDFNVGHTFLLQYATNQFGQATFDGLRIRHEGVGESSAFTVYGSGAAQFNAATQADGSNAQLVAMYNPNVANLTAAAQGMFTNKATTHDIAIQYRYGTGTPIDAILVDANPTSNAINAVIINNDNGAVPFRVAGQSDPNLIYANGTSRVGIGTSAPLTKLEVQGTASASNLLTIGGLQVAGGASVAYSRFGAGATTHSLNATNDVLTSGRLEVDGLAFFDAGASVSVGLETVGYSSASQMFGAGLTNCTGTFDVLRYSSATGLFSCGVEGGGLRTELSETTVVANNTNVSFDGGKFALTASGTTETLINLNWGAGGPASLSQNETVTGAWTFSGGTAFANASASGTFEAAALKADSLVASVGTLDLGAFRLNGAVTGNNQSITGVNGLSFVSGSASGTFESVAVRTGTLGADAGLSIQPTGQLTLAPGTSFTQINGNASLSGNFELTGTTVTFGINSGTRTDTMLEIGGTASISSTLTLGGALTSAFTASNSFAGSVDVTKGVRARDLALTGAGAALTFTGGGTNTISSTGTLVIGAHTLAGAITGNSQNITGLNNLTFVLGSASGTFEAGTLKAGTLASDAGLTIAPTSGLTSITGAASVSTTLEATTLKATTIGGDGVLTIAPTTRTQITGAASVSTNIEVVGYASASKVFGAGLRDCDNTNQKLLYTASGSAGGTFSCGYDNNETDVQVFTGNGTWTRPASVSQVYVEVWGGGGNGAAGGANQGGGGGGGGGYSAGLVTVTGNVTVTVGAAAGNSSFAGATTPTGNGGTSATAGTGGAGGTATGGTINIGGATGGNGENSDGGGGGSGGGSPLGGAGGGGAPGANAANPSSPGAAGTIPGGGGGGGADNNGTAGTGAAGRVIVWTYAGTARADIAEWYETDGTAKPGDLVAMGDETLTYATDTGTHTVPVLTKAQPGDTIFGVISTYPEVHMGKDILAHSKHPQPIVLAGRVPVSVSTVNGAIKKGDLLTLSDVDAGVAVRTDKAGRIIGAALEDYAGPADKFGRVLVLVQTTYSTGARLKDAMAKQGLDMDAIPENVDAGRVLLAQAIKEKKSFTRTAQMSDIFTDRVLAGLEIVTPRLLADTAVVNRLEAGTSAGIQVRLGENGTFTLVRTASGALSSSFGAETSGSADMAVPVVSFDSNGNAMISGTLHVGVLDAREIVGFADLVSRVATLSSDIISVGQQVEDLRSTVGLRLDALASASDALAFTGPTRFENGLEVERIGALSTAISLMSDTVFFGRPYFNSDTAGFAVVTQGAIDVRVTFDTEYLAQPIVGATITAEASESVDDLFAVRYVVAEKDTHGFTIRLAAPAARDIRFSWTAFAVRDAKTFRTATPTPEPTPEITPEPVVSAGETPAAEPTPIVEPTPDVSLVPEPAPTSEPTPEPAPVVEQTPVVEPAPPVAESAVLPVESAPVPPADVPAAQ